MAALSYYEEFVRLKCAIEMHEIVFGPINMGYVLELYKYPDSKR
jgi:hypothetical protein